MLTITDHYLLSCDLDTDGITVEPGGVLEFDPTVSAQIRTTGNIIVRGTLRMRPASAAQIHRITFEGIDESAIVGGGHDPIETDVGLWVMGAGVLDLVGAERVGWARTATGKDPSWSASDPVIYTPTAEHDYYNFSATKPPNVNWDGQAWRPESFTTFRNVVIEGTGDGGPRPETNGRAHALIRSTSPQTIENVALRHMGPRRVDGLYTEEALGRYALHFHHCINSQNGVIIRNVLVDRCGNHAFVAHSSHGITFERCVAFDCWETPYWWDDDTATVSHASNNIFYDRCAAFLVRRDPEFRTSRDAGFSLKRGLGNRCIGCIAVGCNASLFGSGYHWPEAQGDIWTFEDCRAHNCRASGIFTWQNTPFTHVIDRFTAFRNGLSGVRHGAYINAYHYRDMKLFYNGTDPASGLRRGQIVLHATAHNAHADHNQVWEGNVLDTGQTGLCCLNISSHELGGKAVLFKENNFRTPNASVPVVIVDEFIPGTEPFPSQVDFLRCTVGKVPQEFEIASVRGDNPMNGTRVRLQRQNASCAERVYGTQNNTLPANTIE